MSNETASKGKYSFGNFYYDDPMWNPGNWAPHLQKGMSEVMFERKLLLFEGPIQKKKPYMDVVSVGTCGRCRTRTEYFTGYERAQQDWCEFDGIYHWWNDHKEHFSPMAQKYFESIERDNKLLRQVLKATL